MSPSLEETGVNYFLNNFVIPERGYLNYIPYIINAEDECPCLIASMAAVGLMALAGPTQQPDLINRAHTTYSEAIHHLNSALASPIESVKDQTLMSAITLGLFEHMSNFESWARHVQGAAALVVARGKRQFHSTATIHMFNQVRADMVVVCFYTNKAFPDDLLALQEEANYHPDSSSSFYQLGVLATRCVNLCWMVQNNEEINWSNLLHEVDSIERGFQRITRVLSADEAYKAFPAINSDCCLVYNSRFDIYKSNWGLRVWNSSRKLQLKVYEATCVLLSKAITGQPVPQIQADLKQRLQETWERLAKLGDDLVATVPQALGLVSSANCPSVDSSLPISVSGGYMLTWSLYTAGKSSVISGKTRQWIICCLDYIAKAAGIKMASQLLEDIRELDQLAGPDSLVSLSIPYFR